MFCMLNNNMFIYVDSSYTLPYTILVKIMLQYWKKYGTYQTLFVILVTYIHHYVLICCTNMYGCSLYEVNLLLL